MGGQGHFRSRGNIAGKKSILGRVPVIVLPGGRPLTNDRVGEWLRDEPFRITAPDLKSSLMSLEHAGHGKHGACG